MMDVFSDFEEALMHELCKDAAAFQGCTYPNPVVGAAVYRGTELLGKGVHKKKGLPHAEVEAIQAAGEKARGATIMVTLEPCTHHGSTPPCVDAIINAGIEEVVFAVSDPFPIVQERSASAILERAGIRVRQGLLEDRAIELNHAYMHFYSKKRPFIHLKAAVTLDGKLTLGSGEQRYITGEAARLDVHRMRAEHRAILIGNQTLLEDDPELTIRFNQAKEGHVPPVLFVVAQTIDITRKFRIFESGCPVVLVTTNASLLKKKSFFSDIWLLPRIVDGGLDWQAFLDRCYAEQIFSVLLEGGAGIYSSALQAGIVDYVSVYVAPVMSGQASATSMLELTQIESLRDVNIQQFGVDTCISGFCSR